VEDDQQAAWLAADEKNRAENVMIVDLLRNDLGRICRSGSVEVVELFAVERHPELLQMTSTVRGELKAGIGYDEIFRSLFPCGSITGAPKVRTMQAIRELEDGPRGISCGAIGYFAPDDEAVFSVAIRTAVLRDGVARMRVGSGITWDSDAGAEYAECLLKARFLTRRPEQFDLIETLRWEDGYFLLEPHLERLRASAEYFAFCLDEAKVREALRQEAEGLEPGTPHRVRLLLARAGKVSVTSEALSGTGSAVAPGPARMMLAGERTESRDVLLRHKTTRREVYDRALREARAGGFDDAVFVNERGEVTEGAIHNLMIAKGGRFVTPAVACGLLPGVYRRWLLERHPEIVEGVVTLEDLRRADRVMVFNSVRGLRLARVM
jgi:para-aminobenzoate synthetase/4-amino-4-deoxychorismate lyase